jgi:hypothetical protein
MPVAFICGGLGQLVDGVRWVLADATCIRLSRSQRRGLPSNNVDTFRGTQRLGHRYDGHRRHFIHHSKSL